MLLFPWCWTGSLFYFDEIYGPRISLPLWSLVYGIYGEILCCLVHDQFLLLCNGLLRESVYIFHILNYLLTDWKVHVNIFHLWFYSLIKYLTFLTDFELYILYNISQCIELPVIAPWSMVSFTDMRYPFLSHWVGFCCCCVFVFVFLPKGYFRT